MTRTIEERIEMLLDHLDGIPMQKNTLCRNMIRAAFAEPWLDAPDGPGSWWRRPLLMSNAIVERVISYRGALYIDGCPVTRLPKAKWQRVIGPSE